MVLMEAERAWSYAMQLKQEANTEPRKRFHLLSRLRKAAKHSEKLEKLCESPRVDAKTKLEAQVRKRDAAGELPLTTDLSFHRWSVTEYKRRNERRHHLSASPLMFTSAARQKSVLLIVPLFAVGPVLVGALLGLQ